jgi:uncharacterized protein (DUF1330 family)
MPSLLIKIGKLNPDGEAALGRYAAGVISLIEAAGETVLTRGAPTECMVGTPGAQPDLVAVMQFPLSSQKSSPTITYAVRFDLAPSNVRHCRIYCLGRQGFAGGPSQVL